jgi:uncharacterized protein (TIGR03437 family)
MTPPSRLRRLLPSLIVAALAARAQPGIGQNGVVNSASRIPPTLAGGAIARGALFTIYGVHFGSAHFPTVTLKSGEREVALPVLKASRERIDARMPSSAPLGKGALTVSADGRSSPPFPMEIAASNPGMFSRNQLGWGPGEIKNIGATGAQSENTFANPAHPGQRVTVFVTGLGNLPGIPIIVGGQPVKGVSRHAQAGRSDGRDEIEFSIPRGTPEGCHVPVYVLAAPDRASNVVTIAIRSGAGICSSTLVPLFEGGSAATGVVSRTRMRARYENTDKITDEATIVMTKTDRPFLSPLLLLPPTGSCTAYTSSFQTETVLPNSIGSALVALLQGRGLDAGSQLTFARGSQTRGLRRESAVPGYYHGRLGQAGIGASRRATPLFLEPGDLEISGSGGKDIGPFDVRLDSPEPFEWLNREEVAIIDRSRRLAFRWRDSQRGRVIVILATNVDQISTAIGTCVCVAEAGSGEFSIPAALLANVPRSENISGIPYEQVYVAARKTDAPVVKAAGVEAGAIVSLYTIGRFVQFR